MKKSSVFLLLLVLAGCFFLFSRLKKEDVEKSPDTVAEKIAGVRAQEPAPASSSIPSAGVQEDLEWMDLLLSHQLSPESIEAWTQKKGIALDKQMKGHPRSGQRLELSWGTDPSTTAVFDLISEQKYQLSAVRSLYPQGTNFSDVKVMLQDKVKRPVEREDENSVVFTADERGLTVWMARHEDGSVKVAFEYGAHTHGGAEPHPE